MMQDLQDLPSYSLAVTTEPITQDMTSAVVTNQDPSDAMQTRALNVVTDTERTAPQPLEPRERDLEESTRSSLAPPSLVNDRLLPLLLEEDDHGRHSEEALPSYNPDTELPTYDRIGVDRQTSTPSITPRLTYHMRQQSRSLKILVPFGPSPHVSYSIVSRTRFKVFGKKKKAEITVTSCSTRSNSLTSGLSSLSPGGAESAAAGVEEEVAWIDFANDGKLPWMPKATLTVQLQDPPASDSASTSISSQTQSFRMFAPNFRDWNLPIPTLESNPYMWLLQSRPTALELYAPSLRGPLIARFRHSQLGSRACGGAEVGVLEIFGDESLLAGLGVPTIVGSLAIVMENFRRMGRHLWGSNDNGFSSGDGRLISMST